MNGVQTVLKCKPNVKRCKRFVFVGHSPLLRHNALKTKAINHFQTDHILTRFVFPPLEAGNYDEGQRNSFLFSMLVMASYIIRADGRIMHSEMEYVRQFLRMNFGEEAVIQGEQILLNLFEQRKQMERQNPMAFKNTIHECGAQIAANLPYEQRLQLLDFLVNIAKSDGSVCSEEIAALKEVAQCMELSPKEVESMLNLSGNSLEEAYKVLEIDPSATNEEVRTAYRRLALKHHPDRVATLGEDVKKAAEEKFQQINNAKERIYKARGIK